MRVCRLLIVNRLRATLTQALLLGLLAPSASLVASESPADHAGELLKKTVAAYRQVPALRDTLRASVTSGDTVSELRMDYALGAGMDAELSGGGFRVVSLDGRVSVIRAEVADKYLEASLEGTLHDTLVRILGDAAPAPVAPLSIRHAKDATQALEDALAHLGMNLIERLTVAGTETIGSDRGRELHRLHLEAIEGRVELDIRPDTFLLTAMRISRPASESSEALSVEIRFDPEILESAASVIEFDPENRKRVNSVDKLVLTRMEAGEPAPTLALSRLSGGLLALPQLRGHVAVLDFFSTACESCAERLGETERLASWARSEDLGIVFVAVNTLEEVTSDRQARPIVAEYVDTHEISLPTLLDWNHELVITLGAPVIPTLYVIAPSGDIAAYYDGAARPSFETMQKELLALAGPQPAD